MGVRVAGEHCPAAAAVETASYPSFPVHLLPQVRVCHIETLGQQIGLEPCQNLNFHQHSGGLAA